MRKWTYLVAALLMGGATATFTSCIDTDEPAGITDLRGAKAELLRAKAAYQTALANTQQVEAELQMVKVEREKVELEMDKLRQEMMAAENAWKQDSLQARRDTLAKSLEIKLVEMQQKKAEADFELQKAMEEINAALITMKDDIYSRKISYYKALLIGGDYINDKGKLVPIGGNGASKDLATAESELFQLENQKVQFVAENQFFQANLEVQLAKEQKVLEIQQGLRDDLDKLNAVDVADLNAQLAAKTNEQKALDTKEGEAIKGLEALRAELQPTDEQLAELDKQKQAKKTYTIAVADIADASMHGLLKDALTGFSYRSVEHTDLNYVFSVDPVTGEVTMNNDYTLYGDGYSLAAEENILNSLAANVKAEYQDEFVGAYNALFNVRESAGDLFNGDGSLKDNVIAKVDNELDRLEIDLPNKKAAATADSTAWVNAYAAYQAALVAYGDYKGTTTWDAIVKQVADYNALPATTTAAAKAAAAETLRKAIIGYLDKREAVDGFTYTPDFRETYKTAFTESTDLTAFNAEMGSYESYSSMYLGASVISTTVNSLASASDKNLLAVFLKAANKVFGGNNSSLNDAVQPEAYKDGEATKYRMPAGYEPENGTYGEYLAAKDAADIFSTINEWIALYQGIDADAKASAKVVADIDAQQEVLTLAAMEQYSALWQAEVEAYLIKGANTTRRSEIWSINNPYSSIYNWGGTGANVLSEYDAIQQEINYISSAISGGGTFEYVIYNPSTGEYSTVSGTLTAAINALDQDIEDAKDAIVNTQTKIDLYKEFGFTGTSIGSATSNNCLKLLEKEIAEKEAEVELLKAEVTRIQATMKKLLDAYTAE